MSSPKRDTPRELFAWGLSQLILCAVIHVFAVPSVLAWVTVLLIAAMGITIMGIAVFLARDSSIHEDKSEQDKR